MAKSGRKLRRKLVLVPYPFQGHVTPMLQLGSILHSKGFSITIVHPTFNAPNPSDHPNFIFEPLPDKLEDFDTSLWNMLAVIYALNDNCKAPLEEFLQRLMEKEDTASSTCIIYDPLMRFSASVANDLKLPSIMLRTCCATDLLGYLAVPRLHELGYIPLQDSLKQEPAPELNPLRFKDLPLVHYDETWAQDVISIFCDSRNASAMIWNTLEELEHSALSKLQQHYQIPQFPLGPLHKLASATSKSTSFLKEDTNCIEWLNRQSPKSVIYVSLGSLAVIDEKELAETAWGLAKSNQPFLWVIRPGSISGSPSSESEWIEHLPKDFAETTKERGLIVKWAPQKEVLAHTAVGGFLSHCGWNSTLECVCAGVPMICWPRFADQKVNARLITHVWKIGFELENDDKMERGEIERAIARLMTNKGQQMRQRTTDMKEKVNGSVQEGGSTYNAAINLAEFILSL